ncbi:hypothetical protein E4M02_02655 [Brevundimonas sp. S30B]|uniref:hypothetical protein n=1 Tax=unclassified Brevundimonas TaxID=2622653 RepID=UPI001071DA40|nr:MULTISPECIES: hypothetical protein [unclassified Brevundimonas]QBX37210.1 hypothetical protein E4M01_05165 [Brevundimonas sp. MF30-B]TFW03996.1 hypothetical protein E4M02_02655 [Brevundimonas sp. S30B]
MGKAKDLMIETHQLRRVAEALGIEVAELEAADYEVEADTDRDGNVIRTFIIWHDEVPDGVDLDPGSENETTIILPDDPDGPD